MTEANTTNHATIYDALAAAQSEFEQVYKNGRANYGRYATLDEILRATRPALNRHGIYLFQKVEAADGGLTVETVLGWHGETISSGKLFMPTSSVKGGNAAQAMGSARTYACRYSLSSFLGIAADDDDDGQSAGPRGDMTDHRPRSQSNASTGFVLTQDIVDAGQKAAYSGMSAYQEFWKAQSTACRKSLTSSGWHDQLKAIAEKSEKAKTASEENQDDSAEAAF